MEIIIILFFYDKYNIPISIDECYSFSIKCLEYYEWSDVDILKRYLYRSLHKKTTPLKYNYYPG